MKTINEIKRPDKHERKLKKNNLNFDEINTFIFHQANKFMLNYLRKKLKIEESKFPYFMREVGNTVSSTLPIVMYEEMKTNNLKGNILLAGFGVGYSWGGCVLKI
jgi:3-oxoacyl-[acyl-carrier-protein] synthase-3